MKLYLLMNFVSTEITMALISTVSASPFSFHISCLHLRSSHLCREWWVHLHRGELGEGGRVQGAGGQQPTDGGVVILQG